MLDDIYAALAEVSENTLEEVDGIILSPASFKVLIRDLVEELGGEMDPDTVTKNDVADFLGLKVLIDGVVREESTEFQLFKIIRQRTRSRRR